MKKMFIYEPAMCCSTGLCGVSVDPELLRISIVTSNLKKNGIDVVRYDLTNSPQEFVNNTEVNALMMNEGVEILPITVVEGKVAKKGAYPTNDELVAFLEVPKSYLGVESNRVKPVPEKSSGCGCSGGSCC